MKIPPACSWMIRAELLKFLSHVRNEDYKTTFSPYICIMLTYILNKIKNDIKLKFNNTASFLAFITIDIEYWTTLFTYT